jgi:hypothetical protein
MRWPAASRFGLACIALVACWSNKKQPAALENSAAASKHDMAAAYLCSIEDSGFTYPQMPCAIRQVDGRFMLAKLAGSQRFRGEVKPRGEGFSFDGEFYCPWGDCTQPLHGVFKPTGNGGYRGTFESSTVVVTLIPAPADSAWGGASYGGDGYGGFGYGGFGYGGAGYGGSPANLRNHRR